jgi:homotetrameric cytidine deaminase
MEDKYLDLLAKAKEAVSYSYSPYSKYPVGAAVLWDTGKITAGCNVENSSFGLTVCAERNAIYKGISEGEKKIAALAVSVPDSVMPSPCGACCCRTSQCRQINLAEYTCWANGADNLRETADHTQPDSVYID